MGIVLLDLYYFLGGYPHICPFGDGLFVGEIHNGLLVGESHNGLLVVCSPGTPLGNSLSVGYPLECLCWTGLLGNSLFVGST